MSGIPSTTTFDVRIWGIRKVKGAKRTSYEVRWVVAGRQLQRTFSTIKLAEGFRATLLTASREGAPFDIASGLPAILSEPKGQQTWFDHTLAYVQFKWPHASPRHRKGIAEALTTVTAALVEEGQAPPDAAALRRALNKWAYNGIAQKEPVPDEYVTAIKWIRRHSLPLATLAETQVLRRALDALSRTLEGKQAANSTITRKRATFNNALEYAVELELFKANPLRRVRLRLPKSDHVVDRRVLVNVDQARALLAAVADRDPALEAFFACLYFAGLRPAEARNIRLDDCILPSDGWGSITLTGSHQYSGSAWTDSGKADEERALKHRSRRDVRRVPLHPELVETLVRHVGRFKTGTGGRLFVTRTGRAGVPLTPPFQHPVSMGTVYNAWHRAREAALTPKQFESMLARRPYDLRHACLSTWLNAGVPPAQVAEWAGHGVDVLLKVYAGCLDGQEHAAKVRIEAALGGTEWTAPSEISPRIPRGEP
jgi:integrase